ncbi:hypothetical protein B0T20DRAFT_476476 [Sordaria brevicollis]|uniref:DUF4470 domain-containing protein n=1 Tax=Sordaria brevicollis TaxID=83679 RepID=A0AAE0PLR9_SORBR|nr:hypothetical protein B0T20DRAFT_476476 [Sordaria brevicollis]
MLTPAGTGVLRYSYPMGDTPAVCLTQDIPPSFRLPTPARVWHNARHGDEEDDQDDENQDGESEQVKKETTRTETKEEDNKKKQEKEGKDEKDHKEDNGTEHFQNDPINILLLGCGDLRKILFTISRDKGRRLDITCCDNERSIIARNILLLTLLVDSPSDNDFGDYFPIYYNFNIAQHLVTRIASQALKLVNLSDSLEAWHRSTYGRNGGIRFCDSHSVAQVREIWQCWAMLDGNITNTMHDLRVKFAADLAATRAVQADERLHGTSAGGAHVYTAVRSVAPAVHTDMRDLNNLHRKFWGAGDMSLSTGDRSTYEGLRLNPMFVTPDAERVRIHWGLNPLLGFPLAEAYTRLTDNPELGGVKEEAFVQDKLLAVTKAKFTTWCRAFSQAFTDKRVVTRWFVGDAISFGHTLQSLASRSAQFSRWYRSQHSYVPLKLDGEDYQDEPGGSTTHPAPLSFMVIDTSNLIDDLGALNVLVATSPLLENNMAATIYTEMLTRYHRTYKEEADNLLCGPLPTVALLLGLSCVEHSTNTSSYPGPFQDSMTY